MNASLIMLRQVCATIKQFDTLFISCSDDDFDNISDAAMVIALVTLTNMIDTCLHITGSLNHEDMNQEWRDAYAEFIQTMTWFMDHVDIIGR